MFTVLVVAAPHARRAAWTAALEAAGDRVVVAPTLLSAMAALDDDPCALVYEPRDASDHAILGVLSNARDLPPVVLMAPATVPVATRVPSLHRLAPDSAGACVVAAVAEARTRAVSPLRLPFRLCPAVTSQWTVRISAARAGWPHDPVEAFDGATQPEGYALTE